MPPTIDIRALRDVGDPPKYPYALICPYEIEEGKDGFDKYVANEIILIRDEVEHKNVLMIIQSMEVVCAGHKRDIDSPFHQWWMPPK